MTSDAIPGPRDGTTDPSTLLSADAVRERAHDMLRLALEDRLDHLSVDLDRLGTCADAVIATMRAAYPDLEIPFHSRWRHFTAGGLDRWGTLREAAPWSDARETARAAFDLAVVSVLLDAGAGPDWRYEEGRTGESFARSEGLAIASLDMFLAGAFSSRPDEPWRVDADALVDLTLTELTRGMQVTPANPLVGLEGRVALLNRLGEAVLAAPDIFALVDDPRPGGLFDHLAAAAPDGMVAAPDVLRALLLNLGPVWPGRIRVDGVDLGDTWHHPALAAVRPDGLVPFHKLSQWLAYSLLEPLEEAGFGLREVDGLTGLPEYRNGGLLLDTGVLRLKRDEDARSAHAVSSPIVVEWRALTVALLDRLAGTIRERLALDSAALPLAKVLEGGTWATGRRLAAAARPGGAPPLAVISDGTVF